MFGKALFIMLIIVSADTFSCDKYFKIGTGYKIDESDKFTYNGEEIAADYGDEWTARVELGCEINQWSFGLSHHSQWFSGPPFNDDSEYYKTEIFLDYKFYF